MQPKRPRNQFNATVTANIPLCRDHFRLVLGLPDFPETLPGHFIQVACNDLQATDENPVHEWQPGDRLKIGDHELADSVAVLRRPFSLAGRNQSGNATELHLIHRVVGLGTNWMAKLRKGDRVGILGPLGNTFTPPPRGSTAIFVGGGVGIPPMLYLAAEWSGKPAVAFAGALTRDLLPLTITDEPASDATPKKCVAEFSEHGIPAVITTDDGSCGMAGFVTQALEIYLDRTRSQGTIPPTLYTCGPEAMMKRVADIAIRRGLQCQVAVERAMACGMGTCQSCCIRVKKKEPARPPLPGSDWCYRLACTDGPIFQAAELLW